MAKPNFQALIQNISKIDWQSGDAPNYISISIDDFAGFDLALQQHRQTTLNAHSKVVASHDGVYRVYRPRVKNMSFQQCDAYGAGVDYIRGTALILQSAGKLSSCNSIRLKALTEGFRRAVLSAEDHKKAVSLSQALMGVLQQILVENDVCQASGTLSAIHFISDYLWQRDFNNLPLCTYQHDGEVYSLQVNVPMRFKANQFPVSFNELWAHLDTTDVAQPAWFKNLVKKTKPASDKSPHWIDLFMAQEGDVLKTLPPTSMTRFSPNPSNAYRCYDVIAKKHEDSIILEHVSTHHKTAITEPLESAKTQDRQAIATLTHKQMVLTNLEENLSAHLERWQGLLDDKKQIDFTVLHQTLIGDSVIFSPDEIKSKRKLGIIGRYFEGNVIDTKAAANQALRQLIKSHRIYFNSAKPDGKRLKILSNAPEASAPEGFREVNLRLLETNNGINIWHHLTRIRNNDIEHARVLIDNTVGFLDLLTQKIESDQALAQHIAGVKNALLRSNYSFLTSHFGYSQYEKNAFEAVSDALTSDQTSLPLETATNLSLMLQSSKELKRTVHESIFSAAYRKVNNSLISFRQSMPVIGVLAEIAFRPIVNLSSIALNLLLEPLKLVSSIFMGLWNLITPSNFTKFSLGGDSSVLFNTERKSHAKAKYEGIVSELQGQLFGGCMSSADRANEMGECRFAEKRLHYLEGKVSQFNDSLTSATKEKYLSLLSTVHKHNAVHSATGSMGTKDGETMGSFPGLLKGLNAGLAAQQETKEEIKLSAKVSKLRELKSDKAKTEKYSIHFFSPEVDLQSHSQVSQPSSAYSPELSTPI